MISVCIATYNGEDYILEQLESILVQLPSDAEVLICDDNSADNTVSVISGLQDSRIKLLRNHSNVGYIRNFERLIADASGEYIFLSDQDDVWPVGRVSSMLDAMSKSDSLVVAGGMELFNSDVSSPQGSLSFENRSNATPFYNLLGIFMGSKSLPYYGCCMLLSRGIKDKILPFPTPLVSHDIWIALISNIEGKACHIADVVTYRRIHSSNVTKSNRDIISKVMTRISWVTALVKYLLKHS